MLNRRAYQVAALALEMLLSPVIGAVMGGWLDKRWHCQPWGFSLGLLVGVGAAIRVGLRLYRVGKKAMEED